MGQGLETQEMLRRRVGKVMEEAIGRRDIPGGVVLIRHRGTVVLHEAYGMMDLTTSPPKAARPDGIYDLASLTKPLATGLVVMSLVEEGRLALTDPLTRHLPEWESQFKLEEQDPGTSQAAEHRRQTQVVHLLTHTAGLAPYVRFWQHPDATKIEKKQRLGWVVQRISSMSQRSRPGSEFVYSDLGFILLGRIVENLTSQTLAQACEQRIFRPLDLSSTGFLPKTDLLDRMVPTEVTSTTLEPDSPVRLLRGEVHDGNSRWLAGVSGHAGLFSTAMEVSILAEQASVQSPLRRILGAAAARAMIKPYEVRTPSGIQAIRGVSWDLGSSFSTPRGDFIEGGFGHTGFTGTSVWVDPGLGITIVLLTNRVHPDRLGDANPLRARLANVTVDCLARLPDD